MRLIIWAKCLAICDESGSNSTSASPLAQASGVRPMIKNLTFSEILDRMRTDLAQHYLKDPSFSISQIAWRLGFQELPAFTTAFKRWTGVTPT